MDLPRLRRIRQGAVMSQEELAERSGVARDTISKLETGRRGAYPSTIRKLAAGLEIRPQLLMGGVEYLEDPVEDDPREQLLMGGVEYLDEPVEGEPVEKKPEDKPERDRKVGF